jgi:hypothetical protein
MPQLPAYDLFVSYADADRAWVEGYLLDALSQAGLRCHTETAFALGAPRLSEFEKAVKQSQRTLLVLTSAYLADGSHQFVDLLSETYGAETATWRVIPLVLQPLELPLRLAMLTRLDATDPHRWPEVIERLCNDLKRSPPDPAAPLPCPYPGMAPFREADSERFFGRDPEVQEGIQTLHARPLVAVIGPSGSGKSSLVFAGLVPALRRSPLFGPGDWVIRSLRPGSTPTAALATVVGGSYANPVAAVTRLLAAPRANRRLLLVVDQFEETFTIGFKEARGFQARLRDLSAVPGCFVVLTARADFYPDLMGSPLWHDIRRARIEVAPLDEAGLRQAVCGPADQAGVHIETALVERLVNDAAGEPGALPLVQETLVLLWERLERRYLPLRAYAELTLPRRTHGGATHVPPTGLHVAIARSADAALTDLSAVQQTIARRIFLRLIQFGEGRPDTRRQQPVSALRNPGDDDLVFQGTLDSLTGRRLLTVSGKEGDTDPAVDIAHEALIVGWPKVAEWLADRRRAEQERRRLEAMADDWVSMGRGRGGLFDDVELRRANEWLAGPDAADLGASADLKAIVFASSRAASVRERSRYMGQAAGGAFGAALGYGLAIFLTFWFPQQDVVSVRLAILYSDTMVPVGAVVGFAIGLGLLWGREDLLRRIIAAAILGGLAGGSAYSLFQDFALTNNWNWQLVATGFVLGSGLGLGAGIEQRKWRRVATTAMGGTLGAGLTLVTGGDLGYVGWTLLAGVILGGLTGFGFCITAVETGESSERQGVTA